MFEQRLTGITLLMHDLRWAVSPRRTIVLTLGQRVRRALLWFAFGALAVAAAVRWYAHAYPGEVRASGARLEQQTDDYLFYSLGVEHRGVEVRCLLTVYRQRQAWTLSC